MLLIDLDGHRAGGKRYRVARVDDLVSSQSPEPQQVASGQRVVGGEPPDLCGSRFPSRRRGGVGDDPVVRGGSRSPGGYGGGASALRPCKIGERTGYGDTGITASGGFADGRPRFKFRGLLGQNCCAVRDDFVGRAGIDGGSSRSGSRSCALVQMVVAIGGNVTYRLANGVGGAPSQWAVGAQRQGDIDGCGRGKCLGAQFRVNQFVLQIIRCSGHDSVSVVGQLGKFGFLVKLRVLR